MVKYLSFHNSSFCPQILSNVNGKATVWDTPCWSSCGKMYLKQNDGCIWTFWFLKQKGGIFVFVVMWLTFMFYFLFRYYTRQKLTDKSDVFSFGIVLLELICGQQSIDTTLCDQMEWNIGEWVSCKIALQLKLLCLLYWISKFSADL